MTAPAAVFRICPSTGRKIHDKADTLIKAIYWGVQRQEESTGLRKGKRPGEHWPLHEWRLVPSKAEAEAVLAGSRLRYTGGKWQAKRKCDRHLAILSEYHWLEIERYGL